MPIYEYKCARCATVFDELCSRGDRDNVPPCPQCNCVRTKRQVSMFAGHSSEGAVGGSGGCGGCRKGSCAGCRH